MDVNQLKTPGDGMTKSKFNLAQNELRRYAAPTLKIYGGVIELTASGTQAGTEGGGVGNAQRKE